MAVLGIDLGGTKIAAGLVDETARLTETVALPTLASEGYSVSRSQLNKAIEDSWTGGIDAIGICAPGPLNPKTGVVLSPPNLPGWRNIPLAAEVAERFGVPCRLENDANAAGLAEALWGAGQGFPSVLYVTIGTGIGTGIILDRKIYHGKNGQAAEGGHVVIDYRSEAICNCGSPGCIEALASGVAIGRRAGVDCEMIGQGVAAGSPAALKILDEAAEMLGVWLGSMINVLDPDVIVVGGGVAQLGEPLFERLRETAPRHSINPFAASTPIAPARLGKNAGVLGAAAVAL